MKPQNSTLHLLCLSPIQIGRPMAALTTIEAEEGITILEEAEAMVDLVISILKTSSLRTNLQAHKDHRESNLAFMVRILVVTTNLSIIGQHVKSVESLDTMPLTAIIGWILLTKEKIHLPSLLQWPMPPTPTLLKERVRPGSLTLVLQTISQQI